MEEIKIFLAQLIFYKWTIEIQKLDCVMFENVTISDCVCVGIPATINTWESFVVSLSIVGWVIMEHTGMWGEIEYSKSLYVYIIQSSLKTETKLLDQYWSSASSTGILVDFLLSHAVVDGEDLLLRHTSEKRMAWQRRSRETSEQNVKPRRNLPGL